MTLTIDLNKINIRTSSLVQLDNLLSLCEELERYELCANIRDEIGRRVDKYSKIFD